MPASPLRRVGAGLARLAGQGLRTLSRTTTPSRPSRPSGPPASPGRRPAGTSGPAGTPEPQGTGGAPRIEYAPQRDGDPDPGEIVWAWVAYEEDASRGKDRPVLVVAREGATLLGLMLTSKDHDRDRADEARHGRTWMDVGTGAWDSRRRPSEVRLDRLLHLDPASVRREGAALARDRFDEVAAALRALHGWH